MKNYLIILLFLLIPINTNYSQIVINDEFFNLQWYLHMSGNDFTRADIRVMDAWNRTMGNTNQKIAIVESDDSGANGFPNIYHEDLLGRITNQGLGFNGDHATSVAGIIVANHNNIGIAGINKYAQLYAYVYTNTGQSWVDQVRDARLDGNKIINISSGVNLDLEGVGVQLAKAYNNNIVNVSSVGNNNSAITYPAKYFSTIAVGSSTKFNTRSTFSNFGPQIEFLAPGGSDFSNNNPDNIITTSSSGSYHFKTGTSLAAPIVSGAASLLLSYKPNLSTDDIKNILINSCDKLPEMQGQNFTNLHGYGRINLKKSFQLLEQPFELNNTFNSIGGYVHSVSDYLNYMFWGIDGLINGNHIVKRYEVRKVVYFDKSYTDHYAWGQGWNSIGWSSDQPNFGQNYCTVVEGSLESDRVTLRTYVYEVWRGYSYKGWWPCRPENVKFSYTVLGKPLVAPVISHFTQQPNPICKGETGFVRVHLSQGNGNLTYNWFSYNQPSYVTVTPSGNICYITYHNTIAADGIEAPTWDFGCTVSNSAGQSTAYYTPALDPNCYGCPTLSFDNSGYLADENPLLITSLNNPGVDVTDYYCNASEGKGIS
jgi:hypothetical protein